MKLHGIGLAAALLLSGAALAQDMELQVELMGPLGTKTSRKGDRVFGRVKQPEAFKGATVEGSVTEVRSGGKIRGGSVLNFNFATLQHAGQAVPITTQIRSFQNSRGQADVDEEGRVIRKGTHLDLSKRRAEAVKAVLVAQFHVDAARLSSEVRGSTKPVAGNDTPQGRAQNRRVEFIKQ